MSKLLIIKCENEYSYRRKDTDDRIWLLSDEQIKQVEEFVVKKFFK